MTKTTTPIRQPLAAADNQVFDTEADAIALANDSEYRLAASIWTRDVDRPLRIAREIQAGTVWINEWVVMRDEFEEGGYKQSGRGRLRASPLSRISSSTSISSCSRASSRADTGGG